MSTTERSCVACGASVARQPWSDYWRCGNDHVTHRGPQQKPERFELRLTQADRWTEMEPGGTHDVWDLQLDEPFYDRTAGDYMQGLSESRARSVLTRLQN